MAVVVSGAGVDGVDGIVVIVNGISGCSSMNTVVVDGCGGTNVDVAIVVIRGRSGDAILIVCSVVNTPVIVFASFILTIAVVHIEVAIFVLIVHDPLVTIIDIFVAIVSDVRTVANLMVVLAMRLLMMLKLSVVMTTGAGFLY
ncbi:Hypothetical predicted protein [Octopus vulgaris]|uniref:Uncharacterized protein n=1 Tax=Octopus vulgaris TaxID=6645 RepID=A0AA36BEF9_OCTVU|nr:Hypothetical predicted protein [Octopus vulgaris]